MTEAEALAELKSFPVNCLDFREQMALDIAIEALEKQEVAKEYGKDTNVRSNGWIPCSERLPEFDQEVLITADDCTVYQCVMRNGGLCVFEDGWIDIKHVIAWQPLPAPYQKGE